MTTSEYKPTHEENLFQKYYKNLINQTINAHAHLELWRRLENYKSSYLKELNQAPHFFTFTMRAHLDDTLLTLSRILDRHEDSLSIWKFLNFVEQNLEIFSNEAFSQRMKGRTNFYEEQVESHIPIARKEIDEDRDKLKSLEDTLNNLLTWRDKVIAHIDRKYLLKGKTISKEFPLQLQKLEEVINALVHILNRYSDAYNSSTYLVSIPGEDDVQHVMNCIRFRIHEENSRRRHS